MPDYISKFTGQEIDDSIQKSKDINKTATEINSSLNFTDKVKTELNATNNNELLYKDDNGNLSGSGIVNEADKIFFPKDGRFPSASIDVGPAITLSESGGWVMNTSHASGKNYIVMDYEIDTNGTQRPIYWERGQQEQIIIQPNVSTVMNNFTTYTFQPTENAQINEIYYNFVDSVTNLRIRYTSNQTGKVVKYIPNESSWRNGTGITVESGIQPILLGTTSFSELTSYSIKVDMIADNPISLRGNGTTPYVKVDRQLITSKGVLLQGEGTGSPDTAQQIRDKLTTLTGTQRLDASAIKNLPSGTTETGETIKTKLETLTGDNRLSANAIKDLPSGGDTAIDIKEKLETLTGADKLSATAIKDIVDVVNRVDGGNANAVFTDTMNGGVA